MNPPVDLLKILAAASGGGAQWGCDGEDLNLTLVSWPQGGGAPEHVNDLLDVAMIGIEGEGLVEIDGAEHSLAAGQLLVIPKGARRRIAATSSRFAYLNVHRRRVLQLGTAPARVRP
ncbi:MAG: cupin domain-containing protein [Fimbriimonadaceae bacterium]|nr:cupin domain-containing protein [Fimbriimonadaceae bacterium]